MRLVIVQKPFGLNMIPGGRAGIAFLHKLGALAPRKFVSNDERDTALEAYLRENKRKGIPNPLVSQCWLDAQYAAKVICSGPNRFPVETVRLIRSMDSEGADISEIAKAIGLTGDSRIKELLAGKTYSRVR